MNHSAIRPLMPTLVAPFVPSNCHRFKYRIYDDQPPVSPLGFQIDPLPFEGKVIALTDEAIVIKVKRTEFAVLDRHLVNVVPAEGSKVSITPYARRHFDGQRVGTPRENTEYLADGTPYVARTVILGDATTTLPVPAPRCPKLAQLIEQLEQLSAPDGFRRIAHLLVDAHARDFTLVDPERADIVSTPPAISFTVTTGKFSGQVTVSYDRVGDAYVIDLHHNDALDQHVENIYFDSLGEVLEQLIDDGRWRCIQVEVLSAPGNAKRA